MTVRIFRLAVVVVALVGFAGCGGDGLIAVVIERDGVDGPLVEVWAERAITADERRTGLRGHPPLASDRGLLIELPIVSEVCIVTTGVDFAIDAVYASDSGEVVAVEVAIPAGESRGRCHSGVLRVLETAAGVAAEVRPGDRLISAAD